MLDKNGKRMLAYVQTINNIQKIEGADNIELVHVNAWPLIALKGEFKEGDKCVYIEIDSKVPSSNPAFEFLASKKFKVKPYKLGKFKVNDIPVVSMGLALPLEKLGIEPEIEIDTDLTDRLGITYYVAEDNARKADSPNNTRFAAYKKQHAKFYNNPLIKWLMRFAWFRNWQIKKHGGPKQRPWPSHLVSKTDEERVQNMPWILEDKDPWIVTEKIDGTSTTIVVERIKRFLRKDTFKEYICSRNVCFSRNPKAKVFNGADNIYTANEARYHMVEHLTQYLIEHPNLKFACIQGESYGEGWQGNPLKMKGTDFAGFNFKTDEGRFGSVDGKKLLASWGIPWVPIIYEDFILPDTVDELIELATGPSALNPEVLREGWVIRKPDGTTSFKAVSTTYLLNKKE